MGKRVLIYGKTKKKSHIRGKNLIIEKPPLLMYYYLLFPLLLGGGVLCGDLRIASVNDLVTFSNNVNKGSSYEGTTVFLDSDINFSGKTFEPIGFDRTNCFLGTFDGQGYIISNIVMKPTLSDTIDYTGLFGFSEGATIKNVVMNSISHSSTTSNSIYWGSVIGYCEAYKNPCIIENVVNRGNVLFNENIDEEELIFGGIAGYLYSDQDYKVLVKNCANYGSFTHAGTSGTTYIGGIVGYTVGWYSTMIYIQNCLNVGPISNENTKSSEQHIGGIVGYSEYTLFENCVNFGKITSMHSTGNIGGIGGEVSYYSQISNCHWGKNTAENGYGLMDSDSTASNCLTFDLNTFELSISMSVGSYTGKSLLDALNAFSKHYYLHDYSKWILNKNSKSVSFTLNGKSTLTMSHKIILLPSLASDGKLWFDGWYTDSSCKSPLKSFDITAATPLYGKWGENTNKYTITFDIRRKGATTPGSITSQFGTVVLLPNSSSKDSCKFKWWETDYCDKLQWNFTVPARDLTLYAVWSCVRITNIEDFFDFSEAVNSGTSFRGTTIFLNSDLDFTDEPSQQSEPIGNSFSNYFLGTFDGQGYIFSNLSIKTKSDFVGLFGFSRGSTIKNVVMDSSCSVTSYYDLDGTVFMGGIIGGCWTYKNPCIIENNVNMGKIETNEKYLQGNFYDLWMSGIVGDLESIPRTNFEITVRNCVNYGPIIYTGTTDRCLKLGGIVGQSHSGKILNCLNYGSITKNGTTDCTFYIGGIVGESYTTEIENCVSAGRITLTSYSDTYVGSFIGFVDSYTNISYSFQTSEVNCDTISGTEEKKFSSVELVDELDTVTMYNLNSHLGINSEWSRWVMLHLNGGTINDESQIGGLLESLPIPVKKGQAFHFWCTDNGCDPTNSLHARNHDKITDLYACWTDKHIVKFDGNGGTPSQSSKTVLRKEIYGELPTATRSGYTFLGWFTAKSGGDMIGIFTTVAITEDQTLYAHWAPNTYKVTFNGNGGSNPSPATKNVTYDSKYGTLATTSKTGYAFSGWFTAKSGGNMVTKDSVVKITAAQTLYAHKKTLTVAEPARAPLRSASPGSFS